MKNSTSLLCLKCAHWNKYLKFHSKFDASRYLKICDTEDISGDLNENFSLERMNKATILTKVSPTLRQDKVSL